jgi:hypothetical protein
MTDAPTDVPPPTNSPDADGGTQTPNQHAAASIAQALADGTLQHPGNPQTKQPPVAIINPMFRTTGRPPQQANSIRANNQLIAEAIIHHINTKLGYKLTPADQANQ